MHISGVVGSLISPSIDKTCEGKRQCHKGWCEGGRDDHVINRCCEDKVMVSQSPEEGRDTEDGKW